MKNSCNAILKNENNHDCEMQFWHKQVSNMSYKNETIPSDDLLQIESGKLKP